MLKYLQNIVLISKKIWQTKRSLRGRFIIYLLALFLLLISALLSLLNLFGVLQPLNRDLELFLDYELQARNASIDSQMNALAAHSTDLSQQLSNDVKAELNAHSLGSSDIKVLNNNPQLLNAIQQRTYNTLLAKMQQAPCSGALYLLNASVNTKLENSTYNGLFLKFTNIHSENTLFNEICMFRGNPQIARQNNISLYSTWQLELDVNAFPQTITLLHSDNSTSTPSFLLTKPANLRESWEQSRLFLMPVYAGDNSVIGLCGFEISNVYFQQRTHQTDYNGYPLIMALLDKQSKGVYSGQLSSPDIIPGTNLQVYKDGAYEHFVTGTIHYIGKSIPLKIGSSEHKLAVMLPETTYSELLRQSRLRLALILSAVLGVSLLFCYFFSKKYVEPIINDLAQLQQNPSAPPQSDLLEINQFFEFLQNRHAQQKEHMQQLVEQRTAAQQQYGLAAKHLQDAEAKQQALEDQYTKLKKQLQALQAERDQAQKEKDAAQQQLHFAQSTLERVVEKKLQTVDPDNYQLFIDSLSTLTRKEEEIFNLYVQGYSTKEIISKQQITENTLKYHNKNIYSKLGVKTRKELLQYIELMRNIKG